MKMISARGTKCWMMRRKSSSIDPVGCMGKMISIDNLSGKVPTVVKLMNSI
jgi:hypothetical protein